MSDKIWHYTVGDDQFGPVSADELKKLAAGGKISPTDQVWKEGMDDWMSASDMQGLFADAAGKSSAIKEMQVAPPSNTKAKTQGKRKLNMPKSFDPLAALLPYGHAMLMFGFLLVIFSRGCDSLGSRGVARAGAKQQAAKNAFNDKWDRERNEIQEKISRENEKDSKDQDKIEKYNKELAEIAKDRRKAEAKLAIGTWYDLQSAARDATTNHTMSRYWYGMLFVLGTLLFVVGLITLGFRGEESERKICLIMLAIVAVGIYVVGNASISSFESPLGQ
jgi:hypothetical protein